MNPTCFVSIGAPREMIIKVPENNFVKQLVLQGRNRKIARDWIKEFEVSFSTNKNIWSAPQKFTYESGGP